MDQTETVDGDIRVEPSPNVLVQRLPDAESVLLDLDREEYHGLDAVGTRFWEVLAATPSVEAAYRQLSDAFDADPETLRRDLDAYVSKLTARGLLRRVP